MSIELRGVVHRFGGGDDRGFALGPIDLVLRPGEIVFFAGGNGSGKTTLAKVLLGLYPAESGEIRWDGASVGEAQQGAYRGLFGCLFAEVHLFERLYGVPAETADAAGRRLLERLRLARKVTLSGGVFSTIDLSQGQQKRLALVSLLVEDRAVYVLDEWAAEQDPEFKRAFYTEILPELRAQGKTVIVVSHDDHYFSVADRILHLEDGRVRAAPARPTGRGSVQPALAAASEVR